MHIRTHFSKIVGIAIACLFLLASCSNEEKAPDVSNIKVTLETHRLDMDLAQLDTNNIAAGLQQLDKKYPRFLNFYLDTLMHFEIYGHYSDTTEGISKGLRVFLTNKDYRGLFDTVKAHYPDTKEVDAQLKKGFQYMKYYYPDYHVPRIMYVVSWLNNWAAFTVDEKTVGIGLDMFLGKDYPFYASVGLPAYMDTHFTRDYMPVAVFGAIYNDMHPFQANDKTLLDMMIERGKAQYFLKKVLPFKADSTIFGFTGAQIKWCNNNEADAYNFFVKEGILYSTSWTKILRYVSDGPNSAGMPSQSPGNIGSWLGYRIVDEYMKRHPKTTMEELFNNNNSQQILQGAEYKPR